MSEKLKLYSGNTEQIQEKAIENGAMYVDTEAKSLSFDIADDRITIEGSEEYDDTELKDAIAEQGKAIQEIEKVNQEQDVNITYVQEQIAEINTSIDGIDGEIETLTDNVSKDAERITALEQKPDVEPFDPSEINEAISALQSKDTEIDETLSTLGDLAIIDTDGNANHFLNGEGEWVNAPAGSGSSGGSGDCIEVESFGAHSSSWGTNTSTYYPTDAEIISPLFKDGKAVPDTIKETIIGLIKTGRAKSESQLKASLGIKLGLVCSPTRQFSPYVYPNKYSKYEQDGFALDDGSFATYELFWEGGNSWDDYENNTYVVGLRNTVSNYTKFLNFGSLSIPVLRNCTTRTTKKPPTSPSDFENTEVENNEFIIDYLPIMPIWMGGTGAYTGQDARTNLAVPYLGDFNDLVARVEALETANASLLQANNTLKAQNASLIADIQAGKTKRIYENADFDEEAYKERIKPTVEEEIEEEE